MTEAFLGFKIDSSQASSGAADLDRLQAAAVKMDAAAESLTASAGALANALRKVGDETKKVPPVAKPFMQQDEHVKAFRAEVERLTDKYQPLVAAGKRHEATLSEIQRAYRLNIITAQQMTQQIDQERLAYERLKTSAATAGAAVKAANANAPMGGGRSGGQNFNAANTMFQFQDIAMTAAMGMNPAMIAMQQGSQLAGGFAGMGAKQALMTTGSALVGMLNPLSLVTIGFTAATAAAIQYFMTAEDGSEATAKLFEQQNDSIRRAAELWGQATPQFQKYVNELDRADKITQGRAASDIIAGRELDGLGEKIQGIQRQFSAAMRGLREVGADPVFLRDFSQAFGDLRQRLEDGTATTADYTRAQMALAEAVDRYGVKSVLNFRDAFDQNTASIQKNIAESQKARAAWIEALAGGSTVQDILSKQMFTDNGQTLRTADFVPRNAPVPGRRPNVELSGEQGDSSLSPHLTRLLGGGSSGSSDVFSPATQSANGLNAALGSVSTTLQTVNTGVIDVSQSLAMAKMQQLSALESTTNQVRGMKSELREIKTALEDAAETPLSEIFTRGQKVADDTISGAVAGIEKLMLAMKNTGASAMQTHEGIERIRSRLKQLGGDTKAVDLLVDSLVAGYREVTRLEGGIKSLSASIMNIPNKMVNIGIRQYTVPSSGGGTKGINVYGAGADFTATQYDVGGGKSVGVYSGNGAAVLPPRGLVSQNDIDNMLSLQGYRAAGGPVDAGGTYLVGEEGPEILKMSGAGHVTNAGNTASILSGGRDALSMIEDHAYDMLAELRIHTDYMETNDADNQAIIACLKRIESVGGSSSYSGGGSGGRSYRGSSGSSDSGQSHLDPYSPYYFNAARNNAGRGGGRYDPVADALMNGNTGALRGLSGGPTEALSRALGAISGSGGPSLLDRLKKQAGFATGGQIMPGEDQKVEFFKRRKERVIIVDNDNVSDQRGGSQQAGAVRDVNLTVNFPGGNPSDPRSRQAMTDEFVRAVKQAVRM